MNLYSGQSKNSNFLGRNSKLGEIFIPQYLSQNRPEDLAKMVSLNPSWIKYDVFDCTIVLNIMIRYWDCKKDKIGIFSTPWLKNGYFSYSPWTQNRISLPPSDIFFFFWQFCNNYAPLGHFFNDFTTSYIFLPILPPSDSFFYPVYPPRTVFHWFYPPQTFFSTIFPSDDIIFALDHLC